MGKYVCVSSVVDSENKFREYRFIAKLAAESKGYKAVLNPEDKGITQTSFENVLNFQRPIFILIIGIKKSDMVKKECEIALKKGLEIIAFLKKSEGNKIDKKTEKFAKDISIELYDKDYSCFSSCEELYKSIINRLETIEKDKKEVKIFKNKDLAYAKSTELIKEAKRSIVICQETSSLVLGPRSGNNNEKDFYNELIKQIENSKNNHKSIIHIFSYAKTKKELNNNEYNSREAIEKLKELHSEEKVIVKHIKNKEITPFVIADNTVFFYSLIGEKYYSFLMPRMLIQEESFEKLKDDIDSTGLCFNEEDFNKFLRLIKQIKGGK